MFAALQTGSAVFQQYRLGVVISSEHYCLIYWLEECYSEVMESKLVKPKEASVGAVAKVKQAGKVYCESIVAVGTKVEIDQKWKEMKGGDDSDKATKEVDKG